MAFACYCTVPLLIPVLTSFPPQASYMGDILGGGFILGLASYAVSLAAIDSGSPYAQLGSSRLRTFGALGEPTILFVVFTVALVTGTDLPYVFAATLKSSAAEIVRPAHLLAAAAFFMVVLSETGRIPIENHGGTLEFGMIDEGRTLEHSGPGLALLRWGSSMKQLILYVILADVLLVPWGLAGTHRLDDVVFAIGLLLAKALAIGLAVVVIESSFAKLRLYKIPEFTVASFLLAVLAVVTFVLQHDYGQTRLTVFGGVATVAAVAVLLLELMLLRSQDVWEQLRLYAIGSAAIAVVAFAAAAKTGNSDLYAIGAITIAFKTLLVPVAIGGDHPQPRRPDAGAVGRPGPGGGPAWHPGLELRSRRCVAVAHPRRQRVAAARPRDRGRDHRRLVPADDPAAIRSVATDRLPRARERCHPRGTRDRARPAADPCAAAALRRLRRPDRVRAARPVLRRSAYGRHHRRPQPAARVIVEVLLILLLAVPVAAAALSLAGSTRLAEVASVLGGVGAACLTVALAGSVRNGIAVNALGQWLRLDSLGAVFLLATGFLYGAGALFSVGYLRAGAGRDGFGAYARRYYVFFNLFGWTMLLVPLMNDFATLWVAVELTTIVSVLLVAVDRTDAALEAAWKYVLIASVGLGIGLLAVIVLYAAGTPALGDSYLPRFASYAAVAHRLPVVPVEFAFLLAVVGFGTKVGFAPMHTWLPDAHSEAPSPISALLSGALLANALYAILRFYQVTAPAAGDRFPRDVLLVFGTASLLLAALFVLRQENYKRLLAYSSVEHMGVIALGIGFGVRLAVAGALLHVLNHAAAKSLAFFGSGSLLRRYDTKEIERGTWRRHGRFPSAGQCFWRRRWRSAGYRSRASSAASSRSSAAGSPNPPTSASRCSSSSSTSRSSACSGTRAAWS